MKIELCEDNGIMNDGKPTLVILQVTDERGKVVRMPYQADKTIQELYEDVKKMPVVMVAERYTVPGSGYIKNIQLVNSDGTRENLSLGTIEREDLVKCIKVIKREIGMDLDNVPKMGGTYRVIDIHKAGGEVIGYDVLDDISNNKIRMQVFKDEVALHQKFIKPAPRVEVFSVTKICQCGELNAISLNDDGNMYAGKCDKCGAELIEQRSVLNG